MTTQELIEYYSGLLIIQYGSKPKAKAHIEAMVQMIMMDQMPLAVRDAFTLGSAVGAQLDVIGKYVGASRVGYTPTGLVTLDDSDYTKLIKLAIIKNTGTSSLYEIQTLIAQSFGSSIRVSDNQTMQLNYVVLDTLGSPDFLDMLTYGDFLPKPMGVQVAVTVVPDITNFFFGARTYGSPALDSAPLNSYSLYQTTYPWLSYQGVINV